MSDGITIPLDVDDTKAKGKIARLKRDAGQAGKAFGAAQAGALAGRVGGPGGGIAARLIGGGPAGAGVAVAGLGLSAFLASDARRVDAAVGRAESANRNEAIRAAGVKSRASFAAGAMSIEQKITQMKTRGIVDAVGKVRDIVQRRGISASNAADSVLAADGTGQSADIVGLAMATGEFSSANDAVESMQKFGGGFKGLRGAIAARRGVSEDDAYAQIERSMVGNNPGLERARSADLPEFMAKAIALNTGETADALESASQDALNPEAAAMRDVRIQSDATVKAMVAGMEAQSKLAAAIKTLGSAVGMGEGSELQKLGRLLNKE